MLCTYYMSQFNLLISKKRFYFNWEPSTGFRFGHKTTFTIKTFSPRYKSIHNFLRVKWYLYTSSCCRFVRINILSITINLNLYLVPSILLGHFIAANLLYIYIYINAKYSLDCTVNFAKLYLTKIYYTYMLQA